jgi:hypothetical protein
LYKEQWLKLLDTSAEIRAFIVANEGHSASFIVVPDRLGILVNSTLFLQPRASDVPNETSDVPNEKNSTIDLLAKENAMLEKKIKSICRGC